MPGSVPAAAAWRCDTCCGPKSPEFPRCYGCRQLFGESPQELATCIVPITSAPEDGGAWYSTLISYKQTDKTRWPFLTAVVGGFIETHRQRIDALLGGEAEFLCVVPSTRGVDTNKQPLMQIARLVSAQGEEIPEAKPLLVHSGQPKQRNRYNPDLYYVQDPDLVRARRIILLDDSWASGASAISAAGVLLDRRAAAVIVLPIARLYNANYWDAQLGSDNGYSRAMKRRWQVDQWPKN